MNIGSGNGWPSSALSNFAHQPFVFMGVPCNGREGPLQAFKFDKVHIQREICLLTGKAAKFKGKKRNSWKHSQTLYWAGVPYARQSPQYQHLLDHLFEAAATNPAFIKALLATNDAVLTHTMGATHPADTVLTQTEFCRRLTHLRERAKKGLPLTFDAPPLPTAVTPPPPITSAFPKSGAIDPRTFV